MLHACFYTICLLFRYTSWHFYAFSGTNLLTSCHSASSPFLLFLCFRVIHRKYSRNWTKQVPEVLFYPEASRDPKESRRGATRAPHAGVARPGACPREPRVRAPGSSSDIAPSPIKTPRRKKPKYPITFPEHITIRRRRRPEDWEGPEALPGTLPERGIATGGLLHCHACLRSDE
jgi:hypothetical protein